jgi:SAM-dependent methyltransferase
MSRSFEDLVEEADSVSVDGWDFSWLEGRATEERPLWGYSKMMAAKMQLASAALDIQTGGGEVLAGIATGPAMLMATESWPPNIEIARRNLARLKANVVEVGDDDGLPFADESFDLVVSRHPTLVQWDEISRVLKPGGAYFSQQVGAGSNRELTDFIMGPQPVHQSRAAELAVTEAEESGLVVTDLREQSLRVVFYDVGAVIYFLRKVIWTVPGFTVERYRQRLGDLHESIASTGSFVSHAQRFLIEARRPG